jgi:hypothetical protein
VFVNRVDVDILWVEKYWKRRDERDAILQYVEDRGYYDEECGIHNDGEVRSVDDKRS